MASTESARRALARLWPQESQHLVVRHEEDLRFTVPGLTAKGRVVRPFDLKRVLWRWLANLPMWILWRLFRPDWLWLWLLLYHRPTAVRARDPNGQAVRLARALVPIRMEGVLRRPWLIISPRRVGVFVYIVGEATMRWAGVPISVAVKRRLKGFYVRLEFLDDSTAVIAVSETQAQTLQHSLSTTDW